MRILAAWSMAGVGIHWPRRSAVKSATEASTTISRKDVPQRGWKRLCVRAFATVSTGPDGRSDAASAQARSTSRGP